MDSADLQTVRRNFAERIQREAGIRSSGLIKGLAAIPREQFVGPGPWQILQQDGYQTTPDDDPRHLYDTVLVALDPTRGLNNGEPASLLRFLDMLDLAPGDRFLHIGCGVGYYTAIAAQAVLPNGTVVGVELDRDLAERAKQNLRPYKNVNVIQTDGNERMHEAFDAIFVNAGATNIQPFWLDQLAEAGRLLVPLTVAFPSGSSAFLSQSGRGHTLLVTKKGDQYAAHFTSPVAVFHCVGARSEATEQLLDEAFRKEGQADVRSLRRDQHNVNADCWLHTSGFCLSRSAIRRAVPPFAIKVPPFTTPCPPIAVKSRRDFAIRLLESSDSISDLTLLIRRAYKVLADMGFNYTGTYQDEVTTQERIADGECYVMLEGGKIIGTITLCLPPFRWAGESSWYSRPGVVCCGQFAVEPNLQRAGRGSELMDFIERRAAAIGASEVALDTAEGATHLVNFYKKRGYRFVEHIYHEGKTYRSVILSKSI